ncbi:hypothetical protein BGZ58_003528 [Dissophora ornata]|nr:hypothetical protein BGZ58_003528 [Dissophora ornata]
MHPIRHLTIARSNSIGDNGAVTLSGALKTNSTLATLDLHRSLIGDNGAVALSEALKTNLTLSTLDLSYNSIHVKDRADRTGASREQNRVTEKKKRNRLEGQQARPWVQMYGRSPRANECLCGKSLMEHENGQCPGEQPDPRVADRAVLASLKGLQYLRVMERRGGTTIELLQED